MTAPRFSPGYAIGGKYAIRAPMTYGGAAATYAAAGPSGRDVVVRLVSPELAARADVLAALQQATAVTNALPADTTAPIVDSGFDSQTRAPYTVTELVPLPSLAQTIANGVLSIADVVLLVRGIARAIDAAHAQRLAHGGLKPQNVFVGPAPQRPVRVVDFNAAIARSALPTNEGYALAAPWIAPEQLQGGLAGPAVDVFSTALVAFFAATGRSYWLSCQGPMPDLARWQKESAAPRVPPSVRARELGANLPPVFDQVLGRALAPNPAERFGSVGELAEMLARASASLAVGAPPGDYRGAPLPVAAMPTAAQAVAPMADAGGEPVVLPQRSKAGLFIVLALVGVGLIAGVVALVVMNRGPKPAASAASASASASAPIAASAAPAPSESAQPAASTSATAPAPSASQAEAQDGGPSSGDAAELTIVCTPECDAISIDGAALQDHLTDPVQLPAGVHALSVGKATYVTQTKKVTLTPGQQEKVTFVLYKPGPAPPKRCGKFLERCP